MNDWNATQIKEIVRLEIEGERRLRDALRKEDHKWLERELKTLSKALELQAKEYERRLIDLNNDRAEARKVLNTYVTRELYERAHNEVVEWQRKTDLENVDVNNRIKSVELGLVNLPGGIKSLELGLAAQSGNIMGTNTTRTMIIAVIAIIVASIGGLIGIFSYFNR